MADPDVPNLINAGRDWEAARVGAGELDTRTVDRQLEAKGEPMEPLTQLGQLAPLLAGVVGNITPEQLERPTPCADFTVNGVLDHMISGATTFAAAYRGTTPTAADLTDVLGSFAPALTDLGDAIGAPGALDTTVEAPFGELDGATFARFIVLDGLVHGWDLASATEQTYEPPDDLVAAAEAFARETIDPLRDGGQTFADPVEPPPGASPIERLAAYTGRTPINGWRSN